LKDIQLHPNTNAAVLGTNTSISLKQSGKDVLIDLSNLQPGDIAPGLFTIKLTNVL
jgi:hypothetical protein